MLLLHICVIVERTPSRRLCVYVCGWMKASWRLKALKASRDGLTGFFKCTRKLSEPLGSH